MKRDTPTAARRGAAAGKPAVPKADAPRLGRPRSGKPDPGKPAPAAARQGARKSGPAKPAATDRDALPIGQFPSQSAWAHWLELHHAIERVIWVRLAKKGSGVSTVSRAEAVETALCYGWIDGQARSESEVFWLQRFTPRRPRSKWSKVNCAAAERLIAEKRMAPAGRREVEAAKKDGRWASAYAPQRTITVPEDLQARLAASPRARAFFAGLDSKNRYAILYRLHDAKKPETRLRRLEKFVRMLEAGETLH